MIYLRKEFTDDRARALVGAGDLLVRRPVMWIDFAVSRSRSVDIRRLSFVGLGLGGPRRGSGWRKMLLLILMISGLRGGKGRVELCVETGSGV